MAMNEHGLMKYWSCFNLGAHGRYVPVKVLGNDFVGLLVVTETILDVFEIPDVYYG